MKRYLTDEERDEILSKSDRFTAKQLAEQYGCSRSTILKIWMSNNYHKPLVFSYYVDNNYFSVIDTANKAYVVGLMASDGNVYKRNGHEGQIRLGFQHQDSEYKLLKQILSDMHATNPITQRCVIRNGKQFEYISIDIVSQNIFDDLNKIGIIPNKTWTINLGCVINSIPRQFIRDFLRGYFDGDGSIIRRKDEELKPSSFSASISMPLENAKQLQQYLSEISISSRVQEDKRNYSHPFGSIRFFGVNKYVFLKWIYYKDCLCLERKYNLATQYCDLVERNTTNRAENIRAVEQYGNFIE